MKSTSVPRPDEISATYDPVNGGFDVWIGTGIAARQVKLPSNVEFIDALCPLPDGRLIIFSSTRSPENISVLDPIKAALLDTFYGFDPIISPNQRWIAFRKSYPRYHELPVSEEYLVYDLQKSPAENRPSHDLSDATNVGVVIFPTGMKNTDGDNIGVPVAQQHSYTAAGLVWSSQRTTLAFGDADPEGNGATVVLVTIDDRGIPTTVTHPIRLSEVCSKEAKLEPPDSKIRITNLEFGQDASGAETITVGVHDDGAACNPARLALPREEFHPAVPEIHVTEKPTRGVFKNIP